MALIDARRLRVGAASAAFALVASAAHAQNAPPPELTAPVNDFAHVIDPGNQAALDRMIRILQSATGDVVVVATVPTVEPYADIREYANKMFENRGRGIGRKGKDNGVLVVLAVKERRVWVEVGYDLEQWITDGFAGETSREYMVPAFREGRYGDGLRDGTARIIGRIAQGRNVTLDGVRLPAERQPQAETPIPISVIVLVFLAILIISRLGNNRRGIRRWGDGGWSGWSSGVGPFGGGWGGSSGGGGFGGGFGGFGGGRSGGGGGGAGW